MCGIQQGRRRGNGGGDGAPPHHSDRSRAPPSHPVRRRASVDHGHLDGQNRPPGGQAAPNLFDHICTAACLYKLLQLSHTELGAQEILTIFDLACLFQSAECTVVEDLPWSAFLATRTGLPPVIFQVAPCAGWTRHKRFHIIKSSYNFS